MHLQEASVIYERGMPERPLRLGWRVMDEAPTTGAKDHQRSRTDEQIEMVPISRRRRIPAQPTTEHDGRIGGAMWNGRRLGHTKVVRSRDGGGW